MCGIALVLQLYVVDGERNELWRCQLDSTHPKLLINGGISKIASLAVDPVTGFQFTTVLCVFFTSVFLRLIL